jgi:hypothetical protein
LTTWGLGHGGQAHFRTCIQHVPKIQAMRIFYSPPQTQAKIHNVIMLSQMSVFNVAAYIFTSPTCKATIINLEPCALNADFQHFILRFNKNFLLYGYH